MECSLKCQNFRFQPYASNLLETFGSLYHFHWIIVITSISCSCALLIFLIFYLFCKKSIRKELIIVMWIFILLVLTVMFYKDSQLKIKINSNQNGYTYFKDIYDSKCIKDANWNKVLQQWLQSTKLNNLHPKCFFWILLVSSVVLGLVGLVVGCYFISKKDSYVRIVLSPGDSPRESERYA